jgi:arsenate reductase
MAEGLLRHMYGDIHEAYSGGTSPSQVRPEAVQVMEDIGIDISGQRAKSVREFEGRSFDYVVTLCDTARGECPFFAGAKEFIHMGFEDPAAVPGAGEESLEAFRRVRDQIRDWIESRFGGKSAGKPGDNESARGGARG